MEIGTRIQYTGDIANAPRRGTLEEIFTDRWGTHAKIKWDNPNSVGWDGDEPVTINETHCTIFLNNIDTEKKPGGRFHTIKNAMENETAEMLFDNVLAARTKMYEGNGNERDCEIAIFAFVSFVREWWVTLDERFRGAYKYLTKK